MVGRIFEYRFKCPVCGKEWSFMFEGLHQIRDRCPDCGTFTGFKTAKITE